MQLDHERYMRRAIELASMVPDLPFGAVIVDIRDGQILAEGWNRSDINPILHAEIDAISNLAKQHPDVSGESLALYSTAELCPMCQSAILWSGIEHVIYGTSIRYLQMTGWMQIDILSQEIVQRTPFARCTVVPGILETECNQLFDRAKGRI